MSWLLNSSVGKKLIMSITGLFLVLFLIFHATMNVVATLPNGESMYNAICAFLGSNWYAVAGTALLAAMIAIHFLYALFLTIQNRKARGNNAYAVNVRPKGVEWASQNMWVLGLIIVGFMLLHLAQFWYKMMFAELQGLHEVDLGGRSVSPTEGYAFIEYYFSHLWVVVAYLVWYVSIWFHLSHGIWSSFHTVGLSGNIWLKRWKFISQVFASVICLAFAYVTVFFYAKSLLQ